MTLFTKRNTGTNNASLTELSNTIQQQDIVCERLSLNDNSNGSDTYDNNSSKRSSKEKTYYGATIDIDSKQDEEQRSEQDGELCMDTKESLQGKNRSLKIVCVVTMILSCLFLIIHNYESDTVKNKKNSNDFEFPLKINNEIPKPFSIKSPMDLNISMYKDRATETSPSALFYGPLLSKGALKSRVPLPTNSWYQNVLTLRHVKDLSENHRVYTIPYILDFVGSIAGVRVHIPSMLAMDTVVQLTYVHQHGLTLGRYVTKEEDKVYTLLDDESSNVTSFTPLGLHLQWKDSSSSTAYMSTPVIRGMPYATMKYKGDIDPVVASELVLGSLPVIDGATTLGFSCEDSMTYEVQRDIELFFAESDFTWLVFFSQPVLVQCKGKGQFVAPVDGSAQRSKFELHVVSTVQEREDELVVRLALGNNCTTGMNPSYCARGVKRVAEEYIELLKDHADVYPNDPEMNFHFPEEDAATTSSKKNMTLQFKWGPVDMTSSRSSTSSGKKKELLMFALPHHIDMLASPNAVLPQHCTPSLHGSACMLQADEWSLLEDMGTDIALSFIAPRVPHHSSIAELVKAVKEDIQYALPDNYMRGAGDTYFSGKMLAKLGRILVIARELKQLASRDPNEDDDDDDILSTIKALKLEAHNLPTKFEMNQAISRLRDGVQIWLTNYSEARFVYDASYGGLVNCGCWFNSIENKCDNVFPNCPSFNDPGLDFGHAFYNDHHFHQGYHIYAASILASFDPDWGKEYFEHVLLYIRDIANPSSDDVYFPMFRHKDWFMGNSWASGIATLGGQPYPNGRNQESSSEAISAYEGIAMFGSVMANVWDREYQKNNSSIEIKQNLDASSRIRAMGCLLAATELRSASRFYHVRQNTNELKTTAVAAKVYPSQYKPHVVGMMWNTMVQFQTWFGAAPFLAYGIQLMPLTPISEQNFDVEWLNELYPSFANSCKAHALCEEQGWSILQYSVLATIGHREEAFNQVLELPKDVFLSAGGSGHSLTNTLWFISTRNAWNAPNDLIPLEPTSNPQQQGSSITNCGCPDTCTLSELNNDAVGSTCKARMEWLMRNRLMSEENVCHQIGSVEFPSECGACAPTACNKKSAPSSSNDEEQKKEQEKTPELTCGCPQTCTSDALDNNANGYSCKIRIQWLIDVQGDTDLVACSQIGGMEYGTECASCDPDRCIPFTEDTSIDDDDGDCPPCTKDICKSPLNRCPVYTAPYLCFNGPNRGGCSTVPWELNDHESGLCSECCKTFPHCSI